MDTKKYIILLAASVIYPIIETCSVTGSMFFGYNGDHLPANSSLYVVFPELKTQDIILVYYRRIVSLKINIEKKFLKSE